MRLGKLLAYFATSPAVRLLRSDYAPYIVDFLDQQFKRPGQITVPHSELLANLSAYRERVHEMDPTVLRDKSESYLQHWCSEDARWLRRLLEADRNEPVYQLTPHSEEVFAFLDRALDQDLGFVGTESRLRLVIESLADLIVGASDDPEIRLAHLNQERSRIEQEIEQIERDGVVTRYRPAQIRERFATAVSLLKQLQGDFRAVEEKFKEITRQVQQRHNAGCDTRGGILQFALDSEDVLKREDQGVSFYEFVRFILSPAQQEKLQLIIDQIATLEELAEHAEGLEVVQRMVPMLLSEAKKVMRTNQRLSATLRRMLDVRAARERQRLAQLLTEVRSLASSMAAEPPRDCVGLEIETFAEIQAPLSRTFWAEPPKFTPIDLTEHAADEDRRWEAFRALAQMQRLDWSTMRRRVQTAVTRHGSTTLGGLLQEFPPAGGVVEVLGYLQIACDDGHLVRRDAVENVVIQPSAAGQRTLAMTLPLVTFLVK